MLPFNLSNLQQVNTVSYWDEQELMTLAVDRLLDASSDVPGQEPLHLPHLSGFEDDKARCDRLQLEFFLELLLHVTGKPFVEVARGGSTRHWLRYDTLEQYRAICAEQGLAPNIMLH